MHWLNRILLACFVVGVLTWAPGQFERAAATDTLERVRRERDALVAGNRALREEIEALRTEVRALKEDPAEIARIARQDLNLVVPGEVVFELERPERTDPETTP